MDGWDRSVLAPLEHNEDMVLFDGQALCVRGIVQLGLNAASMLVNLCSDCHASLKKSEKPHYSLARGAWIGEVPPGMAAMSYAEELLIGLGRPNVRIVKLSAKTKKTDYTTQQRAIRGTCSTYRQNIPEVAKMLEDRIRPLPSKIFASTISVAFIGKNRISQAQLAPLFSVSRRRVYENLLWLKIHNPLYAEVEISQERLRLLPVNDVPMEILELARFSEDTDTLEGESESYTNQGEMEDEEDDDGQGKLCRSIIEIGMILST